MSRKILNDKRLWIFLAAVFSAYALIADFSIYIGEEDSLTAVPRVLARLLEQLQWSVADRGMLLTLLTISLSCLYIMIDKYAGTRCRRFMLSAFVLSFFTILYYPYTIQGTIRMMWGTHFQMIKSLAFLCGYGFLFYYGIIALYEYVIRDDKRTKCGGVGYWRCVGILALLWFPHLIVKIPGALGGDTESQIWQAMGFTEYNAHQPLFITWLLKIFFWIGQKFFSSNEAGLFLFFLVQSAVLIFVMAYTIYYMENNGTSKPYRNIVWMIYALCPFIVGCVGVVSKDMLYVASFMLFIIFCIHYLEDKEYKICWGTLIGLAVSGALTILSRNNGKEVIYPTVLVICFVTIWHNRKEYQQWLRALLVFVLPIICAAALSKGLVAYYHITPGSIAEALSFPFQQTARTVYEHGDLISLEERDAIDVILHYDDLAERYNPILSDPVKFGYNAKSDEKDLSAYAAVWLKQFFKYPLTYVDATLNQNYALFSVLEDNYIFHYRSGSEWDGQVLIKEDPALEKIELLFVSYYELCFDIPIISLFSRASFYCVILLVLTVFVWCDKKYRLMIVLLPLWLTVAICILGPAIMRHPRYSFPVVYSIPFIFGCYMLERKEDGNKENLS